ncbi:DNJB8 protein, partial [Syrrhaptes paradoxus]|nr:DNJB8 protein [Syrrhaptes paradoxus]
MVNYYKVLGLQKSASQDDIKKSYRQLALKWHPDKNLSNKKEAEKKFRAVTEAYKVLSDPHQRSLYDSSVKESRSHRGRSAAEGHDDSFGSPYVVNDLEKMVRNLFGGMDSFHDTGNNGENWHRTCGRRRSSLSPDRMELGGPWISFNPAAFFAENTAGPHIARSVLTTTELINGKRITIRKTIEDGKETIEVEEDGQLKSVTINGRAFKI